MDLTKIKIGRMKFKIGDRPLYFEFNLKVWCSADSVEHLDPDDCLVNLQHQIDQLPKPSPDEAARVAITMMTSRGFVHEDLDWRHVALRPIIDMENNIIHSLQPVLLDLTKISQPVAEISTIELEDKML
jgi:hypothetical protein